ncbi:AraC family transcriptional regulator [Oceanobacillus sp. CFH 90083]|uniref:AraC family transcriptional regulator n=1 Tax=Oceanobacillus sp. CFH 90083 TaxID=2592336 RepID=UPI00128BD36D|nr:AraC family transcriptional regulator [Oceanobacillus sp. CFH 90083]
MYKDIKHNSYGFRFQRAYQDKVADLHAIGFEHHQNPADYSWHGLERGEKDIIIFQYTLNGNGVISIGGTLHDLKKGDAFFINVPSDHRYYLPDAADEWEFIFFTITGIEATMLYQQITKKHGHLFNLPIHSGPINYILNTLKRVETVGINHGYEASSCAYAFLMEFLGYLEYSQHQSKVIPPSILKAINFINNHYHEDITLDEIVSVSGLSKYYFTRQFTKSVNETPIRYLTKIRIKKALHLLIFEQKSIDDIAKEVGYTSSNYFSKVFKQTVGETPSNYRQNTDIMPVNQLFTD